MNPVPAPMPPADYKTPDGKPQNSYGYDDKCLSKEFTHKVRSRGWCGGAEGCSGVAGC